MPDEQPTQEQIKEFWEWCELPYEGYGNANRLKAKNLPRIDLKNLFEYAVPNRISEITFMYACNCVSCDIEDLESKFFEGHNYVESIEEAWAKSALALFWALWKVKEKSNVGAEALGGKG